LRTLPRLPLGLIGQIFAILLLAILIEFAASTFFYERSSQLSVRDDEARRLSEHLVIARKLLTDEPVVQRDARAADLTTARYLIRWSAEKPIRLHTAPALDRVYQQVLAWEPSLAETGLHVRLAGPPRRAVITGGLMLPDKSWMLFSTREKVHSSSFSLERMLFALGPAVAIILVGGALVRQTLLPMRRLAKAATHVGGDGAEHVAEGGPTEVRRVIRAFNEMQDRIHRMIEDRTQALAAVGHDLRTPLARLRLRADSVREDELSDAMQADIAEMEAMIGSLLAFLGGDGDPEPRVAVDLGVLCATVADDAGDRGRDVRYHGPDHLEVVVRRLAIKRALVNLVENGLHHADRVWITLERQGDETLICVEDDGPGIPEEMLRTVIQPFVRLDSARSRDTVGLGLGLSIVARMAAEEGGSFSLANRDAGGLRAEIRLPG
jgi:signal transduction histidine kinase